MDVTKLIVAFRNFPNAHKNVFLARNYRSMFLHFGSTYRASLAAWDSVRCCVIRQGPGLTFQRRKLEAYSHKVTHLQFTRFIVLPLDSEEEWIKCVTSHEFVFVATMSKFKRLRDLRPWQGFEPSSLMGFFLAVCELRYVNMCWSTTLQFILFMKKVLLWVVHLLAAGWDSSVGIGTPYWVVRSGDRIPVKATFSAHVPTGPRVHSASKTVGTRFLSRG